MAALEESTYLERVHEEWLRQAKEYIKWEPFEAFRKEVEEAVAAENWEELEIMFGKRIAFGTAGLRSKMGGGYSRMNDLIIIQTAQGLLRYAESVAEDVDECKKKGLVIGYDARYNSKRFAETASAVFLASGWCVRLMAPTIATPLVPFGVQELGASLGVVVTASHNPAADNGFKVYWSNAVQIISPHDKGIADAIGHNLEPWQAYTELPTGDEDFTTTLAATYTEKATAMCCFQKEANKANFEASGLHVVYTAMHGIGAPFVAQVFEAFGLPPYEGVPSQIDPDPDFKTVAFPNPEEKGALDESYAFAESHADWDKVVVVANDPDADRLAAAERRADGSWRIFDGNEIAMLLGDYYFNNFVTRFPDTDLSKCAMLASTVSSKFLQSYCAAKGCLFRDTLTGFKWIGNVSKDLVAEGYNVLLAYEVEIGYCVGDMLLDKDGLRAAAVFAEMSGVLYRAGQCLDDKIRELRAAYGYYEMTNSYVRCASRAKIDAVFKALREPEYPKVLGGFKVERVRDVTTGFDSLEGTCALPIQPKDHMLTFWLKGGATITLRPSGTEPKLKYYVESRDDDSPEAAKKEKDQLVKLMLETWVEPYL